MKMGIQIGMGQIMRLSNFYEYHGVLTIHSYCKLGPPSRICQHGKLSVKDEDAPYGLRGDCL